ncbi:hypothetical protein CIB48_g3290 [Xylaria polymorpha]|nr:hypothetical protein CIB48_g3290 [Xylaria polymorpha]
MPLTGTCIDITSIPVKQRAHGGGESNPMTGHWESLSSYQVIGWGLLHNTATITDLASDPFRDHPLGRRQVIPTRTTSTAGIPSAPLAAVLTRPHIQARESNPWGQQPRHELGALRLRGGNCIDDLIQPSHYVAHWRPSAQLAGRTVPGSAAGVTAWVTGVPGPKCGHRPVKTWGLNSAARAKLFSSPRDDEQRQIRLCFPPAHAGARSYVDTPLAQSRSMAGKVAFANMLLSAIGAVVPS